MSISYEIYKECQIECKRISDANYTVEDLKEYSESRSATYAECIGRYSNLEKAKSDFEDEKSGCITIVNSSQNLILFDELHLDKVEYDEYGEYIQGECLDSYIEDIPKLSSSYDKAYNHLMSIVKNENIQFFEIVEDSYEYENGLILIVYLDREHEHEKTHYCVDIDKFAS